MKYYTSETKARLAAKKILGHDNFIVGPSTAFPARFVWIDKGAPEPAAGPEEQDENTTADPAPEITEAEPVVEAEEVVIPLDTNAEAFFIDGQMITVPAGTEEVVLDPFADEDEPAPAKAPGFEIPADVAAGILAVGEAIGKAKTDAKATTKKARPRITDEAWQAAEAGVLPAPLTFPASNFWMQRKADDLRALAEKLDAAGLDAYAIGGTNTYSKALRGYREACIAYVTTALAMKEAA